VKNELHLDGVRRGVFELHHAGLPTDIFRLTCQLNQVHKNHFKIRSATRSCSKLLHALYLSLYIYFWQHAEDLHFADK